MAAETRARILSAAEELGYRPNAIARALVTKRANIIGVIVGDIMDAYFAEIARGVEDYARPHGCLTMICNADRNPVTERAYLDMLLEYQAAGILFAGGGFPDHPETQALRSAVTRASERGVRIIALAERDFESVPLISASNYAAICDLTTYLIDLGHRLIAFIEGPHGLTTSSIHLQGFLDPLRAAGLDDSLIFPGGFGFESGQTVAATMLNTSLPDAIVAATDDTAVGVLMTLRQAGVDVPGRVSVAGVDGTRLSELVGLTTIKMPMYELGARAAQQIIGPEQPDLPRTVLPHRIIPRMTTARRKTSAKRNSRERT